MWNKYSNGDLCYDGLPYIRCWDEINTKVVAACSVMDYMDCMGRDDYVH